MKTIEVDPRVPGIRDEIPFPQAKQCSPELDFPSCQFSSPFSQKLQSSQNLKNLSSHNRNRPDIFDQSRRYTPHKKFVQIRRMSYFLTEYKFRQQLRTWRVYLRVFLPATYEIHRITWDFPGQIGPNFKGQSFLMLTNNRVWPVPVVSSLRWTWVPVTCRCNLSLTTGSVDQSKNAWKGSALHHIYT